MRRLAAAAAAVAVLAGACADRSPSIETAPDAEVTPTPTSRPLPRTTPPPTPELEATPSVPPDATATPLVLELPVTPSDAAAECLAAGLLGAALDACLQYRGAGCTLDDQSRPCEQARENLATLFGTRIFPSDCDDAAADPDLALPFWCTQE